MGEITNFTSPVLSIEQHDAVATVWLDRSEARNAMGPDLWTDLPRAMHAVSEEAGDASPAPSMAARARKSRREVLRLQASISAVALCPKPVIAAVHGYC